MVKNVLYTLSFLLFSSLAMGTNDYSVCNEGYVSSIGGEMEKNAGCSGLTPNNGWKAGKEADSTEVARLGIDNCFAVEKIDKTIADRIRGKSYKDGCNIPLDNLRYVRVLHRDYEGRTLYGELICDKSIAEDLKCIFHQLYDAGYPIERMVLIDNYGADDVKSMSDNNTSCFNYRKVAGSNSLSKHSLGKAIDINPLYNPYVKKKNNGTMVVNPEQSRKYALRNGKFRYKIEKGDLCYRLFKSRGFRWGGEWRTVKDYQHFEK
ncbi:MAG: M15 family metallopeptidase [Prevotella sp.]|nr:M15 family metallopeptidase [Prevotella sp.]